MPALTNAFVAAATSLIEDKLRSLRHLTYAQVRLLPEAQGSEVVIADQAANLTVFRHDTDQFIAGKLMVVVQVAKPRLGGLAGIHIERGLVFSPQDDVRDAIDAEL